MHTSSGPKSDLRAAMHNHMPGTRLHARAVCVSHTKLGVEKPFAPRRACTSICGSWATSSARAVEF